VSSLGIFYEENLCVFVVYPFPSFAMTANERVSVAAGERRPAPPPSSREKDQTRPASQTLDQARPSLQLVDQASSTPDLEIKKSKAF
jgi:hypothetical protein